MPTYRAKPLYGYYRSLDNEALLRAHARGRESYVNASAWEALEDTLCERGLISVKPGSTGLATNSPPVATQPAEPASALSHGKAFWWQLVLAGLCIAGVVAILWPHLRRG